MISRTSSAQLLSARHISAPPCGRAFLSCRQHTHSHPQPGQSSWHPCQPHPASSLFIFWDKQSGYTCAKQDCQGKSNPGVRSKSRCGVEHFQGLWGCPCGQSAEEEKKLHSQLKEKGEPEGPSNRRVLFPVSLAQQSLCKFSYVLFGPAANWLPDRRGGEGNHNTNPMLSRDCQKRINPCRAAVSLSRDLLTSAKAQVAHVPLP